MAKGLEYPQVEQIFEEISLEDFFRRHKGKLPKDLPPAVRRKLLQDAKFLSEYGALTDRPETALFGISKEKTAYPNYSDMGIYQKPRDLNKWLQAMRSIQYQVYKGEDRKNATERATKGWDEMEKLDFEHWMRYYQSGDHLKYKTAQVSYWEPADKPGYALPLPQSQHPMNPSFPATQQIQQFHNPTTHPDVMEEEKRERIEQQRQKIISRLDSAEKLLRSSEGQFFAGKEFDTLMHVIYQLKHKINTVNKISTSTRLYKDMIVREANILNHRGFVESSKVLQKVAQDIALTPAQPNNPTTNEGLPGSPVDAGPVGAPGHAGAPRNDAPNDAAGVSLAPPAPPVPSKGMEEFLEGLDQSNSDDLEVSEELLTKAQVASPTPEPTELEVQEPTPDQLPQEDPEVVAGKDFDKVIDDAFANLTVDDAISKLEDVAKIFKVREVPRQLSIVDMMLDRLGLATFFPELSEAINKSLESNNYVNIRVEQVLSRLRGVSKTKELDLTNEAAPPPTSEMQQNQQQLQDSQDKEKARKQMRKNVQEQSFEQPKPTPELEVAEDLSTATPAVAPPIPAPPPAPVR
jgi:hypothetical protein